MPDSSASTTAYPRPPIIEAALELRTDEPLDGRDLERCRDRFKKQYGLVEDQTEINVLVLPTGQITHTSRLTGYKMTAANAVDLIILNTVAVVTSRTAPYAGFDALLAQAQANFEIFTKVVGRRRIVRLAVRFINRIDIRNVRFEETGRWGTFVRVQPSIPAQVAADEGPFYMNADMQYAADPAIKLKIQAGPTNQALIDHRSFMLDIDASYDSDSPQRLDEVWPKFSNLRNAKNTAFEACITDATRESFK
jgi:uncharacterized protein (TIGR04255 family)